MRKPYNTYHIGLQITIVVIIIVFFSYTQAFFDQEQPL